MKVRACLSIAVVLIAAACFEYTPTEFQAIPPGDNVRIYVTRAVMDQYAEVVPSTQPVLKGTVVRRDDSQLLLRVSVATRQIGFHSEQIGQELPIPAREILQVERREFDRLGTGAIVAGTVGLAGFVVFVIMKAYGEEPIQEVCTECADLRVPLLGGIFR